MSSLQQKITQFDTIAFHWCLSRGRAPELAALSRWVSRIGDGILYVLLGALLALFEPEDGGRFLQAGLLAFGIELPSYLVLKNLIRRDRPCDRFEDFAAYIQPSDRFSFPSGHAAAAFTFAAVMATYYPSLLLPLYMLAGLIGAARVMLGVHYPSDILAGAMLGICSAQLGILSLSLIP
ncbi:phosphatase PAP2 family protein [Marinobacterium aestuariivivens]|uniref:undecaprenyl-diphosphate phosphatase n=1 Tax=Marinobacterium aestuariivivens TaxID=1698799 RepID=A0ABW2A1G8_9GAMM